MGDMPAGKEYRFNDAPDSLGRYAQPRKRVSRMKVISGRNEYHVGTELLYEAGQQVVKGKKIVPVSGSIMHRDVIGKTLSLAPASFSVASGSGIMGKLVGAEIIYGVVFLECVLGPVSMMNVEIDDEYLCKPHFLRMPRADRNVIEDAEPHRPVSFGMMARRPYGAEGAVELAGPAALDRLYDRSCCIMGYFDRIPGYEGVRVVVTGEPYDLVIITDGMDGKDIVFRCLTRLHMDKFSPRIGHPEGVPYCYQSFFRLGVACRGFVEEEDIVIDKTDFFHLMILPRNKMKIKKGRRYRPF